jgi:hypothetical protein
MKKVLIGLTGIAVIAIAIINVNLSSQNNGLIFS